MSFNGFKKAKALPPSGRGAAFPYFQNICGKLRPGR
jgi:hypothetical protein